MKQYSGIEIGEGLSDYCRPDRMALVVYDMQIGIITQVKGADETLKRVKHVVDAARTGGFRIIFMRHMSMPKELMGAFQFRQAMAWQRTSDPGAVSPWFLRGSPGFEIAPELEPRPSEAILDKLTFSAFEGTPLAMILRDCGLTAFAICGIATEIGIDPTVRHGADLGLVPVVIGDACGGGHHEAAERSMSNMAFMGDALMTNSAEIIPMLKGR
jgi:nicotinamidase-related amidase